MVGAARETTSKQRPKLAVPYLHRCMVPGQYTVKDAGDSTAPSFTSACHTAFLPIAIGEVVTTISPPLFVWADARCLKGAWCVLATTYNDDAQSCITMADITAAGLVPTAALFEQA